jgi:ubiquinone/menaquinone biosynthesis C-methylase UbiE
MADLVKAKAAERGWENVSTDVLDVRDLKTLEDNTFTHVITNFGFAPDVKDLSGPLKAAKEMYRVLQPGGVAVVTTWSGMCHAYDWFCG